MGDFGSNFHFGNNVTLIGPSESYNIAISEVLNHAPHVVAADGGAVSALSLGIIPDAVIGDFDSIDAATLAAIPSDRFLRISEQETTDFDKCLRNISAPLVLAVGFLGKRLDHQLAAMASLLRHPTPPVVLIGENDISFVVPEHIVLNLAPGTRLSLFPLAPCHVDLKGVRWPLDDALLQANGRMSLSNETVEPSVEIVTRGRGVFAILPFECLPAVIDSLAA